MKTTKRKVLTPRQRLEKKLDVIWSKLIRHVWKCEYCWATEKKLNAHHIRGRRKKSTRRDLDNWVALCIYHHIYSEDFSAHQAPTEFTEWIKKDRWLEWYEKLRAQAHTVKQWKEWELEELYESYREQLKVLEANK